MKLNKKARRKSRELAVQALYQWQLTGLDSQEILLQFLLFEGMQKADKPYFQLLFWGTVSHIQAIDNLLITYVDRPWVDVSPVEGAILRLGAFELLHCPELPYKVVLNESIELSKTYGATDSHKFTNSVLDKLAHQVRKTEIIA